MIFAYPGLKQYAKRTRTRDFDNVGFDLLSVFKDVQLILQTSSDVRVPLSHANNIQDRYIAAIATLAYLEKYDEAMECYDKALDVNPNDALAWDNKGVILQNYFKKYNDS